MTNSKYYWFSFAGVNGNLGVVSTEATSPENAMRKLIALELVPNEIVVDIKGYELKKPEIELDRYYTPAEMTELKYDLTVVKVPKPPTVEQIKDALEFNNNQLN